MWAGGKTINAYLGDYMDSKKKQMTNLCKDNLLSYLNYKYSKEFSIEVIIPTSKISKLSHSVIKKIPNYSIYDFNPDVLGILVHRNKPIVKLVFLYRFVGTVSLKEIGEVLCYSKIVKPVESIIIAENGLPSKISLLLLNKELRNRILNYSDCQDLQIMKIFENSMIPII